MGLLRAITNTRMSPFTRGIVELCRPENGPRFSVFWAFCLTCLISSTTGIDGAIAQQKKLYFHHLNTGNGLSQSSCLFIFQDSYGFIWFSSTDGIMRFDGQEIHPYRSQTGDPRSLFSKNVQSPFFEDKQGDLWFSTYDAIHVYRRKTDDFEHFFVQQDSQSNPNAPTYSIFFSEPGHRLAVAVDNKELYWIYPKNADATNHSVVQKHAGAVSGDRCYAVSDPATGRVRRFYSFERAMTGLPGFMKYRVTEDSIHLEGRFFDGTNNLPQHRIKALLEDDDGILWLATNKGLIRFESSSSTWRYCNKIESGQSISSTSGLVQDGANQLWVSTDNGLALFHKSTETFESPYIPVKNGPEGPAGLTAELYLDKSHVLWCRVKDIGVDFTALDKPKFPVLKVPDNLGGHIIPTALEEDAQHNVWIGSDHQWLKKYKPDGPQAGSWTEYRHHTSKLKNMPHGRMFVATQEGYSYVIEVETGTRYPVKTPDGKDITFGDVCLRGDNSLWGAPFEENGGLWKIEWDKKQYLATRIAQMPDAPKWITRVYQDKEERLYLAQNFHSLAIYDRREPGFKLLQKTNIEGEVQAFYETEAHMWVGGEYGLSCIDKDSWNVTDALPNNTVYGILPGKNNLLWLSTNKGIIRFNTASSDAREYALTDGLQDYEFKPNAFLKTRDGQLWLGGANGINVFYPDSIFDLQTTPNIVITRLQINDRPDTARHNISQIDSLFFTFDQNTLSFDFVALEFSDPLKNKLIYRLYKANGDPYDANWVTCETSKGFARYANLSPGAYVLNIRGANSDGVWNPKTKYLYINIEPPFYKTTWFYLLMILLAIGLISAVTRTIIQYKLRRKNLQLREQRIHIEKQEALTQERNRIAAEMHDDFGSGLTAIQRISERTAAKLPTPEARQSIENITTYSLELISNMREIIWAMSGKNDNLSNLMAYISENTYRYLGANNIEVDIIQPEETPDIEMSGERRRNIYLAVKESLHNVVKHANATFVTITFETNGMFNIHVHDNGTGFENNNLAGNGMTNMRKRITDIGGTMKVENNKGTHVVFSVPIKELKIL